MEMIGEALKQAQNSDFYAERKEGGATEPLNDLIMIPLKKHEI